ncbi:MAG TPA: nucleotidyltransferase family protein [Anaeromyxobacteraceae bacterium]|nr:nucleotidyltransferase family protein [Anaeromyxobacteraceae bacterium]
MPPERKGPVAAVVLAAGSSARMGENKMLLSLGGESVLRRAVRRAGAAGLAPVVVVLGHEADRARSDLGGLPCRPVVNPRHERGMNGSIGIGFAAVPPESAAAVMLLADMPLVTPSMIEAVVDRYRSGTAPVVVSLFGEVVAPPMLYDRSLFPELALLEGDGCGKRVYKRHRDEALTVAQPASALWDLDRPEDYRRLRALIEAG